MVRLTSNHELPLALPTSGRALPDSLRRIAFGVAFALIAAYGGLRLAALLFPSATAVGYNGYYYVLQVHTLLKGAQLYYPTHTPLAFYLLAAVSWLTGDAVRGVKIGTLVFAFAMMYGAFLSSRLLLGSRWCALLAFALLAESTILAYIMVEYAKTLLALVFLFWCVFFALRAQESHRWRNLAIAIACCVASLLCHRSMWILLPALAVSMTVSFFLLDDSSGPPRLWHGVACLSAVSSWPLLPAIQTWFQLPTAVASEITSRPLWPINSFAVLEKTLLLIAAAGVFPSLFLHGRLAECATRRYFLGAIAVLCFLIPLNPFLNRGLGSLGGAGRISDIVTVVAVPILAPALMWEAHRRSNFWTPALLSAALLLIGAVFCGSIVPEGAGPGYLAARGELVRLLRLHRADLRRCSMVLARHGEQFVVTDITDVPAQRERPADGINACWLVRTSAISPLERFVIDRQQDGAYLELVPDVELRSLLAAMSPSDQSMFYLENPQVALRM
ncbi:MAG: glycosyltransferase family 39 protein [Terracidiphilus sp.]|jgi:hypothetical protein